MNTDHAYIGLGSNVNNPHAQLTLAMANIASDEGIEVLACSHFYVTKPVGPVSQDNFMNAVIKIKTRYEPQALLTHLQTIEKQHGRHEKRIKWGPRPLDLDILLYEGQRVQEANLVIPHPELENRAFVLCPLADINEEMILPSGIKLKQKLKEIPMDGIIEVVEK